MITKSATLAVFASLAIVLAACGSSDDDSSVTVTPDTDATVATEPSAEDPPADDTVDPATDAAAAEPTSPPTDPPPPATDPPATDPPATDPATVADGQIPENTSGWVLQPYAGADITSGPVNIYWYRGANGGNYIALYTGPGIAAAAGLGLCPGNSIATTSFMHISNAPSEPGACDGFPTDVGRVQVCDHGIWIYDTMIPGDLEGTLFGSLEWNSDAGITGLTSQVEATPDMAEFTAGLASYTVPPWFTDDGSSSIECAEAIS